MSTYRELIYMCLDVLKGTSDDFSYTEEHIAYLIDKFRAFLLKQRYGNDPKKHVPYSNYQTINIELNPVFNKKANMILPKWDKQGYLYSTHPVASDVYIVLKAFDSFKEGQPIYTPVTQVVFPKNTSELDVKITPDAYDIINKEDALYHYFTMTERPEFEESVKPNNKYHTSKEQIDYTLQLGIPRVTVDGYYDINFEYTSRERLPFVGNNKYLKNSRYCAIDENNYLCVMPKKEDGLNFHLFKNLRLTAIFENPRDVKNDISFDYSKDWKDRIVPIEESLISTLIELVVNSLVKSVTSPEDTINNGTDENSSMPTVMNKK